MSREDPHFRLRFPEALREKVEESAAANKRSMTAEILARLEASFQEAPAQLPLPTGFLKEYIQIYSEALAEGHIRGFMEGYGLEPIRDDETRNADRAKAAEKLNAKLDEMAKRHLRGAGAKSNAQE